jgi:hypothetical protein
MNQNSQSRDSIGATQQQETQQAVNTIELTPSSAACSNVALQNQTNVSFNERPASNQVFGRHNLLQPPMVNCGYAGSGEQRWSTSGVYLHHEGQRLDAYGSSSFVHFSAPDGHNLRDPYTASQIPSQFTGQQQPFQTLPIWQPTEIADFQQQLPNTGLPQAIGPDHTTNQFGLLTPVSTNTQNSPSHDLASGSVHYLEGQTQQIWDHSFDAALERHNASDGPTPEIFLNEFAASPEEQLWSDFDFDSLDGLLGATQMETLNASAGGLNAAAPGQDMQLTFNDRRHGPYISQIQAFDPFLSGLPYPHCDTVGLSSESNTMQQGLHPVSVGQTVSYDTAPTRAGLVDEIDTLSSTESLTRTPARSSQRDNPKNALLIQCKEQGMSYKDIKALGGFEEAESTLRGRYRTLTKPKEERVRRPKWSGRDVSSLHQLRKQHKDLRLEGRFAMRSCCSFHRYTSPESAAFI